LGLDLTNKKIKVLTISDHPLLPSGVGTQTKYVIEALLSTERFEVISLGGAIQHPDYQPMRTKEWGDKWTIFPVNGYADKNIIREALRVHKPDILYFMTDPRFYDWLWDMEDEIRQVVPMVYYHVWDNYPAPMFNDRWYSSNDAVITISKVTSDIVQTVSPNVYEKYLPHSVDTQIFKKTTDAQQLKEIEEMKVQNFGGSDKFLFFWNNRNARRKQSGSLIWWFKTFLDKVGHDKASLLMHTDVNDPNGQPLDFLVNQWGLDKGQIFFSKEKISPQQLAMIYNMADCTLNVSDAEGFGLATLESLACETPIIVTMTGGLQEQVTDGENYFGVGIEPTSKAVIGSQQVPYIYEDRISQESLVNALEEIYNKSKKDREKLGAAGRAHVINNYNFEDFKKSWVETMLDIHEKNGSWETRKNHQSWRMVKL
jgi:glycosyltransferase involved in cell wall biosynthesis